jgi:hypothetical protein
MQVSAGERLTAHFLLGRLGGAHCPFVLSEWQGGELTF